LIKNSIPKKQESEIQIAQHTVPRATTLPETRKDSSAIRANTPIQVAHRRHEVSTPDELRNANQANPRLTDDKTT
jgi:hypothetical protein